MTHSPDWPHLRRVAADARWHSELTELRDARQQLHARAEQTAHGIIAEHRAPRASEQRTLDALFRDINTIDELLRSAHDRIAADAPRRAEWTRIVNPDRDDRRGGAAMTRRTDPDIDRLLRGDTHQVIDFRDLIEARSMMTQRGLVTGTGSAGGDLVPTGFRALLWERLVERSPLLSAGATIVTTDGGGPLDLPRVDTYGTAAGVLEGSAIPESDPTFAKDTLSAYKFAQLVQASTELVQDSGVDLAGFLARSFAVSIDRGVGPMWTAGTGNNTQPTGYAHAAGTAHTGGTGVDGAPTYDDLIETQHGLGREYRRNAVWLMSDSAARAVRKIQTDNGPLWQPAITAGEPDRLLGSPVYIDPYLPAAGTSVNSIAYGDPQTFILRLVGGGVTVERSDDYAFANGLITWRAVLRTDSVLHDPDGFVMFRGGTA